MGTDMLPGTFLGRMERLLGDGFPDFLASYKEQRQYGLRVNTLKISPDALQEIAGVGLQPVPWCPTGFYYSEADRPGKHPLYHAGLYYIQEPSAMAPVELLDVLPGDRVLDLCAAPGGKSTQIAAKLGGQGVLVVNDVHPDRVKALVKNIELSGVRNAVVLNDDPGKLQHAFKDWFDKILIDAPCSGEGMFRKEEDMAKAWRPDWTDKYAEMQRQLLRQAAAMLKPGGRLVYSTCTFSPEENERMIAAFLDEHPEFAAVETGSGTAAGREDWLPGRPDWAEGRRAGETVRTARLWPHRLRGEGHFAAALERRGLDIRGGQAPPGGPAACAAAAAGGLAGSGLARTGEGAGAAMRLEPEPEAGASPAGARGDEAAGRTAAERAAGGGSAATAGGKRGADAAPAGRGRAERIAAGRGRAAGGQDRGARPERRGGRAPHSGSASADALELFRQFAAEQLAVPAAGLIAEPLVRGEHLCAAPAGLPELAGIRVIRPGWYLGSARRGRFEPAHALALGLKADEALRSARLPLGDERVIRYLRGETISLAKEELRLAGERAQAKGYALVCAGDYPLGWAKWQDGLLKNEYPPGWRWT
ncbi:RsmB/NOP family class I SAM-dependent RNA methyltransferase [Paenibacillus ginsengihumi]|uniref:RsmB/NOP family class I SAM-dependent RNA methyltransferase n=1 Tax=Paenibacillus ginsengihumi TaxID=431596 RepID=UPI0003814360|nr:RsmB/NOP family class I SAM-dependent RNA methyltransferase [Paenibacillus ginsengihumi]